MISSRLNLLLHICFLTLFSTLYSCKKDPIKAIDVKVDVKIDTSNVVVKWAEMDLHVIQYSRFNSPTYASRSLGYLGLTMYESIVPGFAEYKSLNGQLPGLTLPLADKNQSYNWKVAFNAAQTAMLKLLYPVPGNSHRFLHERIDSLSNAIFVSHGQNIDKAAIDRSVKFGDDVAKAIYDWSVTDGGDKGYTRNFDQFLMFPQGDSFWIPPTFGQTTATTPLHPTWGNNRTIVGANAMVPVPEILTYSTDSNSAYYQQYKAVYIKNKSLTYEEKAIAGWWSDDPTESPSPPGHSFRLALIAIKSTNASLIKSAETCAKTGLAVADAFVSCWKAKMVYYNERPSSYVHKNIDRSWIQYWPEPPFPAFPSGHSLQSAAAATVLTQIFGDNFAFTDRTMEGLFSRFKYDIRFRARTFKSFNEAAEECAISRFYGGIHTQQDNEAGANTGKIVGQNVLALKWKN
jgi:hypothetical protein